ncbi:hypothetical protein RHMOL_Rhmol03G0102100 [Rhododendron molle]|uniref:Uncharacterized protein n=1 Tax=Rhododendron molle TaxID=49168 RepID=A0ACC0PC93_RHOML|nr:hypothetical protein RHMOL_Rhmol03G0102100 [Rhododendron molle]
MSREFYSLPSGFLRFVSEMQVLMKVVPWQSYCCLVLCVAAAGVQTESRISHVLRSLGVNKRLSPLFWLPKKKNDTRSRTYISGTANPALSQISFLATLETISPLYAHIQSDNVAFSSSCIRMTGALINVLGPRVVPELPSIMENVMSRSHVVSWSVFAITNYGEDSTSMLSTSSKEPLFTSILLAFDAVIDKLDGFLNPYLGDILKLMVLHPSFCLDQIQN